MAKLKNMQASANTKLKDCYKFLYKCSISECGTKYGTDREEKGRHLCPIHDLNFRDNRFKETFAAKLKDTKGKGEKRRKKKWLNLK